MLTSLVKKQTNGLRLSKRLILSFIKPVINLNTINAYYRPLAVLGEASVKMRSKFLSLFLYGIKMIASKLRQVCKLRQRLILYILLFMIALNKPWVVASASLIRNLFYSIKDSQIYCDSWLAYSCCSTDRQPSYGAQPI